MRIFHISAIVFGFGAVAVAVAAAVIAVAIQLINFPNAHIIEQMFKLKNWLTSSGATTLANELDFRMHIHRVHSFMKFNFF